jgi:hypothetical protein
MPVFKLAIYKIIDRAAVAADALLLIRVSKRACFDEVRPDRVTGFPDELPFT